MAQESVQVPMENRTRGDHLGVEQRIGREQSMKEPTVSVGPVHHRRHAESMHGAEVYRVLAAEGLETRDGLNPNHPVALGGGFEYTVIRSINNH